jgi:hypothetical protein
VVLVRSPAQGILTALMVAQFPSAPGAWAQKLHIHAIPSFLEQF